MDENKLIWNIIDCYFESNKNFSVKHHLDSYNNFWSGGIMRLMQEKNPIRIFKEQDDKTKEYKYQCNLFLGGKSGEKIYFGKPIIYDENSTHYMYPNEARLRNMNYGFSVHYDVDIDFQIINDGKKINKSITLEKIYLGRFPIMLQSDLCILKGLSKEVRFNMGECRNDYGGYFIISGKEKVIVCQEKFADNTLYIRDSVNDLYSHSVEIRSVSEDASKPIRTLSIRILSPSSKLSNNQIVVNIPNVRKPIPLFILMRALGIISDKNIIETCILNLEENSDYVDYFRPSVHDAGYIFTQEAALKFIASFTKAKTVSTALEILSMYFLPHIGELNFKQKALFLGYMVKRLLDVYSKKSPPTDRDSFKFKRIETAGALISQLFSEYYNLQQKQIFQTIDKEYYYHRPAYQDENFINLINNNVSLIFAKKIVEEGFKKAFKGNWGAQSHTKRLGLIQDLSRLSYFSFISQLRKLNVPLDKSAKVVGPRLLHGTQWGLECPIHTPDGGNIGLHKHLSIMTHITSGTSGFPFLSWLRERGMSLLEEVSIKYITQSTKIFINGAWVGIVNNPTNIYSFLKLYRRNGLFPIFTSIEWDIRRKEILILTDGGRAMRPIFYMLAADIISWNRPEIVDKIMKKKITWKELIMGFSNKKQNISINNNKIFKYQEIFGVNENADMLKMNGNVIEYIDTQEEEGAFISIESNKIIPGKTTHVEIHPSLILGIMANQIIFPENNPLPRDLFSCGQSKQAVSLYNTNYQNRIDKMGIILNYGQIPIVKSRYLKFATNEQHPYGENVIVAIACYSGYNVEDAIIVNQGSIDRGLFRTTYFNMYESREESSKVMGTTVDSKFCNSHNSNVIRLKPGYDYNFLDECGLIKENTKLNDKIVLIGKCTTDINETDTFTDASIVPKKGQKGYVDKSFMTEGEEGFRLAKIRVRDERIPAIGDKFCSRAGQKGTIGILLPEENMPFCSNGIRPDIIVNPHAFPSRMTIGHLIESLIGKACVLNGSYGDCTAWINKGPQQAIFGEMLTKQGFHSSGTEVLYNGMNGKQIEADIYFGPTYYLRLKHMVKDKINHRARGPRTVLTRQTVQGRANNGGLRIGEMDRDAVVAAGMSKFLNESFMERGDEYYVAICNQSGTIAIYNKDKNLFLSPMTDGPLKFLENLDGDLNIENISRFGRNFSIVRIPYSLKLLYQELQTMNIQMRIVTEDNIDNLTSLIRSNNIHKLTNSKNLTELIKNNISKLTGKPFTEATKEVDTQVIIIEEKKIELAEEPEQDEDVEDAIIVFNDKRNCLDSVNFESYNTRYPNVKTDIPYALDKFDLDDKIIGKFINRPKYITTVGKNIGMNEELNSKLQSPFLEKWNNSSKKNTLDYLFYKIRSGYYIQIVNGVLKNFVPFYNVNFKNTWGHLLNINNISNKKFINKNREQWAATNCLLQLTFKPLIDKYSLDTFFEVKNMFSELCLNRKINDIDLFINVKDFPLLKKNLTEPYNHIYNGKNQPINEPKEKYYPLLSFNSNDDFTDIPIPTNHEWQVVTQKVFPSRCMTDYKYPKTKILWDEKQNTAIFRGTATGCNMTIEGNSRLQVAYLDKEWSKNPELNGQEEGTQPYLNAGITKFANRYKTIEGSDEVFHMRDRRYVSKISQDISIKKSISMRNQMRYKYILNIPGNSAAYRLSFLLRSGSVILNVESENKLWWESKWKPMEHYIPIRADLSDLKEKIAWCKENDAECQKIVNNAQQFADNYITKDALLNYLENIINHILVRQSEGETVSTEIVAPKKKYRVNIIVPFRDSGDGRRAKHLEMFKIKMSEFLPKVIQYLNAKGINSEFDVTIVEQTLNHSFNRGALLNIGFKQDETYNAYIFHDVDLIPNDEMISAYAGPYESTEIAHIASEWKRYKNPFNYLGGVLLVGREIFKRANGFPNNFFGWGGEDDELRRRFSSLLGADWKQNIKLVGKEAGLNDLENIESVREKLHTLTDKNPVRWEGKNKHATTWKENGLNQNEFYKIESKNENVISGTDYKTYIIDLDFEKIKPFERNIELESVQKGGGKIERELDRKMESDNTQISPEETIMFKETIKKPELEIINLGQDIREEKAELSKDNQFPTVTPAKQFPKVIEEDQVKEHRKGPDAKEIEMEKIKMRTEIGGFKWDEESVNKFLGNRKK